MQGRCIAPPPQTTREKVARRPPQPQQHRKTPTPPAKQMRKGTSNRAKHCADRRRRQHRCPHRRERARRRRRKKNELQNLLKFHNRRKPQRKRTRRARRRLKNLQRKATQKRFPPRWLSFGLHSRHRVQFHSSNHTLHLHRARPKRKLLRLGTGPNSSNQNNRLPHQLHRTSPLSVLCCAPL